MRGHSGGKEPSRGLMRRQRWFEIHDQSWFPAYFRDLVTEGLEAVWNAHGTYLPVSARLRAAVQRSGAVRIVDLCSGGGGPWAGLYEAVAAGDGIALCLTDLYPSEHTARRALPAGVSVWNRPVDARHVPAELDGFRTIFSSFHHFDPEAARAMLADAFERRAGIAVFEGARLNTWTLLTVTAVPFLAAWAALGARPLRWDRVLWSCVIPVVPAVLWIDGVMSCLRSYSLDDMRELTTGLEAVDYAWEMGEERGQRVTIRYLIGAPVANAAPAGEGRAALAGKAAEGGITSAGLFVFPTRIVRASGGVP